MVTSVDSLVKKNQTNISQTGTSYKGYLFFLKIKPTMCTIINRLSNKYDKNKLDFIKNYRHKQKNSLIFLNTE